MGSQAPPHPRRAAAARCTAAWRALPCLPCAVRPHQTLRCKPPLTRCPPLSVSPLQYETEFDWGGTKIFVSTCIVEG